MARVFGYLLALLLASSVSAAPVEPRQIGDVGCSVARLKTVTGLCQTMDAVNKVASSGDPAAAGVAADTSDNVTAIPAEGSNNPNSPRNSRIFSKRQIGGIACNIARAQTVSRLGQSSVAVKAVKNAASGDTATAAAADQAGTALNSAGVEIAKIAAALVTLQKAPAAARDQAFNDLNNAMTALASINSTDPSVTSAVSAAQDRISSTIQAGQDVVSNC